MQHLSLQLIIFLLMLYISVKGNTSACWRCSEKVKGSAALDNFPLIDGHNDLAWVLAKQKQNQLKYFDLKVNLSLSVDFDCINCCHTDLPKLKAGKVGGLFLAAYVDCASQYKDAVAMTLEQIDVIRRLVNKYSKYLQFTTSASGILKAFRNKKISCLIGVEGGHSIQNKLSVLRMYYELGVRYMTLTHMCNTPWADASVLDKNCVHNLSNFGKKVVWEMNRLGMMVDLSHVSYNVMNAVLEITKAPVIFSHSSAYAIWAHHRNVRDDILRKLKINDGIIMINFYRDYIGCEKSTIATVVEHINHVVDVCGIQCVGIGTDYNGVTVFPKGLENVSKFPDLFDLLRKMNSTRWTIRNLENLAGRNFVRVFKTVEKVRCALKRFPPIEDWIPEEDLCSVDDEDVNKCRTMKLI